MFRRFARDHPALFTVGVQRTLPSRELWEQFRGAASTALATLVARLDRLAARDRLGGRTAAEAAWQFHALCEGLAAAELRDPGVGRDPEGRWRAALDALVRGFAVAPVASGDLRGAAPEAARSVRVT